MLLLLALQALAGCWLFAEPAREPSPWGGSADASAGSPRPPEARAPIEGCPTVDALRDLLNEATDAPAVAAMRAQLGEPAIRQDDVRRLHWEDYPTHGLSLGIGDGGHVLVVTLVGKDADGSSPFCGALPHGLDFSADESRVEAALGPAEFRFVGIGTDERRWVTPGYRAVFSIARRRMQSLSLMPPLARGATRIANVTVDSERVVRGLRSVAISFDYVVNVPRPLYQSDTMRSAVIFRAGLRDDGGEPVGRRGPTTTQGVGAPVTYVQRAAITYDGRTTIAVPYYMLDLPPGPHGITFDITAELLVNTRREDTALDRQPIPAVTIDMPDVRWVSLGVDAIDVADGTYDSFAFDDGTKPDIFWRLSYPWNEIIFTSPVRSDRLQARFAERSPFFPVVDGDELTIEVLDHDVTPHDGLGSFTLTLDDIASGRSRAVGKVTALSFAPLRTRPR